MKGILKKACALVLCTVIGAAPVFAADGPIENITPKATGNFKLVWDDDENRDGIRPDEFKVRVTTDGEKIDEFVFQEFDNFDYEYDYENIQFDYDKVEGYEFDQKTEEGKTTLTAKHDIATKELSVRIVFEDEEDKDGIRPQTFTVILYKNGEESETREFSVEGSDNEYVLGAYPVYEEGSEIEYSFGVNEIEGYEAQKDEAITFVHTPKQETEYLFHFNTVWDDQDNKDGLRPDSYTVTFNGLEGNKEITLAKDNYSTTITEVGEQGLSTDLCSASIGGIDEYSSDIMRSINSETEVTYTITLSHAPQEPQKEEPQKEEPKKEEPQKVEPQKQEPENVIDITKEKDITEDKSNEKTTISGRIVWDDNGNQDGIRPSSVKVTLKGNKKTYKKTVKGDTFKFKVPKYTAKGKEISYTLSQKAIDGYTTTVSGTDIINTHAVNLERVTVSGKVLWDDNNNADKLRPGSAVVYLVQNGQRTKELTTDASANWGFVFNELPKYDAYGNAISYAVDQDAVNGYTKTINGTTIINTHGATNGTNSPSGGPTVSSGENVTVSGNITWVDEENKNKIRPQYVIVHLLADGKEVRVATVTADANWKFSFEVPKAQNGTEIKYSVDEDEVKGYSKSINGYDIRNIRTDLVGTKDENGNIISTDAATLKGGNAKTGDQSPISLFLIISVLAIGAICGVVFYGKKNKKE